MQQRKKTTPRRAAVRPVCCEDVRFAEVEFPLAVQPRLVIRFSEGLSLLVESSDAIDLAAEFIVAFRSREMGKGGRQ